MNWPNVTWPRENTSPASDGEKVLPSRPLGPPKPPIEYTVYDATDPEALTKLTPSPIGDPKYTDRRIAWGERRCYTVRSTLRMGSATIESDAGPPECTTKRVGTSGCRAATRRATGSAGSSASIAPNTSS